MEVKTTQQGENYFIKVETDEKVAVVVRSESGERIYLPGQGGDDSTYYTEETEYLEKKKDFYSLRHHEEPEEIQIIT